MHALNVAVMKISDRVAVRQEPAFRAQIRDASDSAERNVAEGFGRYSPAQFVHFLDISRASALETKSLLRKGLVAGYWTAEEYEELDSLATRGLQAVAKFQRYLRSPMAKRNAAGRYRERNDPNDPNDPNA